MEWVPFFLLFGAIAGLLAGIFGVGGGAILVPMLIFVFTSMEFNENHIAHLAVGTSFAAMIFTSSSSILSHHRAGNVQWSLWLIMAPMLAIGVVLGAFIASNVSSIYLLPVIGLFFSLMAVQMFFGFLPAAAQAQGPSASGTRLGAFGIGLVSSFFGIGGGTLTVPWLRFFSVPIHLAVGTSAACGLPIAAFGALAYLYFGAQADLGVARDFGSGFIYLPAFIGIVMTSIPAAMIGARLATQMSAQRLTQLFSLLLFSVGMYVFASALQAIL